MNDQEKQEFDKARVTIEQLSHTLIWMIGQFAFDWKEKPSKTAGLLGIRAAGQGEPDFVIKGFVAAESAFRAKGE